MNMTELSQTGYVKNTWMTFRGRKRVTFLVGDVGLLKKKWTLIHGKRGARLKSFEGQDRETFALAGAKPLSIPLPVASLL